MALQAELDLDREAFLANHWQRAPLFIPRALGDFSPPLSRHELAGLAMEDGVESRIVSRDGGDWAVSHGPFARADLEREGAWTLLVQAADHHVPAVAALRRLVDFIPDWRIDDVMVSYASDGAGVGPHYDNYDVFLLQGEGEKVWRTGRFCDSGTPLIEHDELRILRDFETVAEHVLRRGDILYVPPGIAHWGIARGDSTTFSIGFRAPRINDMVARWADHLLEELEPELFYRDAGQSPAVNPGEIRPRDIERALAQLQAALDQGEDTRWFGELVTEPRYDITPQPRALRRALALVPSGASRVALLAGARLAWQRGSGDVTVFANGASLAFTDAVRPALLSLCGEGRLGGKDLALLLAAEEGCTLLKYLLENGCVDVR